MNINRSTLKKATDKGIITAEQAKALCIFIESEQQNTAQFTFTHLLYYFGALIAIGAMTLLMNLGWSSFGGLGILLFSLIYAAIGLYLANSFNNKGLRVPSGLCATFIICLTPLAVFGLQDWLGLWPEGVDYREYHRVIEWHWIYMELSTLVVSALIFVRFRYPFMLMPVAITLWYMAMDVAVMIVGPDAEWQTRKLITMYGGLLMTAFALLVDYKTRDSDDYAFWLYLWSVSVLGRNDGSSFR
ncbi:hypothetical protein P7F88_06775 [Vibrio hannami]|uniref:hypothetical protein n=1 Tax=Vibrio hannami TaxID=2717094 RepID=UPI00240F1E23|nr:hypothetical protein [Vibrio hannami]MDG3085814.1 hypothetical protein [Vibrio hannami]